MFCTYDEIVTRRQGSNPKVLLSSSIIRLDVSFASAMNVIEDEDRLNSRSSVIVSDPLLPSSQFLVYRDETGAIRIDVRVEGETVWLSRQGLAELFQTTPQNIGQHIANVYDEGELSGTAVEREFVVERQEGTRAVRRTVVHYNLDMIISVGYRVKSGIATRFRIWANQQLLELIVKLFVLDDERLKNPDLPFDYFEELTRRIQDIRTSERRFYQKITDIYATSIDYDPTTDESIRFFKTVQNKMHWAISSQTAAEIVYSRADAEKPHMGLTSWRGARVRKADVGIAKNYLAEDEILALNNLVEQYLLFAEGQAMRRKPMHMTDWIARLDAFLSLNERDILADAGRISHDLALAHAHGEYETYQARSIAASDAEPSDFDRVVRELPQGSPKPKAGA